MIRGRLFYLCSPMSVAALRHVFFFLTYGLLIRTILPQNLRCGDAIIILPLSLSLIPNLVFHTHLSLPINVIPGISQSPLRMPSPTERFQTNREMWPLTLICRSNIREMKCDQTKRPLLLAQGATVPLKHGSLLLFLSSRVDGSSTALHEPLSAPLNGYNLLMTYSPTLLIRTKNSDLSLGCLLKSRLNRVTILPTYPRIIHRPVGKRTHWQQGYKDTQQPALPRMRVCYLQGSFPYRLTYM